MAPFKSSWPPPYMSCQGGAAPKEATYFIHQSCHTSRAVIYTEDKVGHPPLFFRNPSFVSAVFQFDVLSNIFVNRVL